MGILDRLLAIWGYRSPNSNYYDPSFSPYVTGTDGVTRYVPQADPVVQANEIRENNSPKTSVGEFKVLDAGTQKKYDDLQS